MIFRVRRSILVRVFFLLGFVAFAAKAEAQANVWVDLVYPGAEDGDQSSPYDTVQEALAEVNAGGTIHLGPGDSHEAMTISQRVTLVASGARRGWGCCLLRWVRAHP